MGYKPDVVQKAKFEYSPLGQVFNKGLEKDEKQGLLKRLKNIDDKTDNQLKENEDNQLGIKSIGYTVRQELSQEAKNMLEKLNNKEKIINQKKTTIKKGDLVINAQNFYDGREMIVSAFKNKTFPFYSGNYYEQRVKMKNHQKVKIKYLILVLLNKLLCWTNITTLI